MGIIANYWRVTPEQFAELQNDPQAGKAFFGFDLDSFDFSHPESMLAKLQEKRSSENFFSLDKEWHTLHFLLTGDLSLEEDTQVASPYWNVVMGGTPTQFEATYGFVRYLNPEEVREVAELLSAISVEELRQRFDVDAFNAAQIYPNPNPDGWDEEEIEFLLEIYPEFVQFFQNAARQGDIVLLSSD
ncbi:YfbM family protein [Nostoc sp. FACHB-87]|uniref:YfbM family protein n=1 Tax=Nostocaceae TaxID=1162 RepID=UPI0016824BD1|nr:MULTISPECIES: YfbM family protein [Nostocaceae]MBD2455534.1 YfbM family protein [Nostoc sp. FACHB-87]MBD2478573.1 YfbM family protein [Anabaena sp. FACHB-83]